MTLHLDTRAWMVRRAARPGATGAADPPALAAVQRSPATAGIVLGIGRPADGDASSLRPGWQAMVQVARAAGAGPLTAAAVSPADGSATGAAADEAPEDATAEGMDAAPDDADLSDITDDPQAAGEVEDEVEVDGNAPGVRRVGSFVASADEVTVRIGASGSDYRNRLLVSIDDGRTWQELGHDNEGIGEPIRLQVGTGRRVSFAVETPEGYRFVAGREDLSEDGLEHARIEVLDDRTRIGFEDLAGGGDLDYDDAVIEVEGIGYQPDALELPTADETDTDAAADEWAQEQVAMEQAADEREAQEAVQAEQAAVEHEQAIDRALVAQLAQGEMARLGAQGRELVMQSLQRPTLPAEDGDSEQAQVDDRDDDHRTGRGRASPRQDEMQGHAASTAARLRAYEWVAEPAARRWWA